MFTVLPRRKTLAFAILIVAFFALTALVVSGATQSFDEAALSGVLGLRSDGSAFFFESVTALGSYWVAAAATALGAVLLYYLMGWRVPALYAATVVLACALSEAAKLVVERPRPDLLLDLAGEGYSYPSSHTMAAVACYVGLALCLRLRWRGARGRAALVASLVIAGLVALSRLIVGWHYPTDVLGSLLLGGALILLAFRCLSNIFNIP
jgi:undecaprenyl-diphosphatase